MTMDEKKPAFTNEQLVAKIAPMAIMGMTAGNIGEALGISWQKVKKIQALEAYQAIVNRASTEELKDALQLTKASMSRLIPKAVSALERALNSGVTSDELQAVKIVFKASGLEEAESKENDAVINVILPGASIPGQKPTIEVKSEKK